MINPTSDIEKTFSAYNALSIGRGFKNQSAITSENARSANRTRLNPSRRRAFFNLSPSLDKFGKISRLTSLMPAA